MFHHALPCIVTLILGLASLVADMQLEIIPVYKDQALGSPDLPLRTGADERVRVSRLDFLLSDIAFQTAEDDRWLDSTNWQGFVSLSQGRLLLPLGNSIQEPLKAVRFTVGVSPEINAADPNGYPAGHPLNPNLNGLHWGWQGGYVFLALEGHHDKGGFSYHIANDANRMHVTLPIDLDGRTQRTLKLRFDLAVMLESLNIAKDGDSTHSRDGDPLAARLRQRVEKAFHFAGSSSDAYQTPDEQSATPKQIIGQAFPLRITQRFPKPILPADNPLSVQGVELGRRLFHDKRLSRHHQQSCASCHQAEAAFTDAAKRFSIGVDGTPGTRNAMPLFNLAWKKAFFWDGRVEHLRDQVLQPIEDVHEMNARLPEVLETLQKDADYPKQFNAAFGSSDISADHLARALEQFLLTQVSQDAKFDQAARGEAQLTPEEQRGLQLFVTEFDPKNGQRGADCFHCHGGNLFTNHAFTNNGLDSQFSDLGLAKVTGRDEDIGKFSTPSLRNVAVTAPYMHDGRFATLEEVIDHYDHGLHRSPTLDPNLAKHPDTGLQLSAEDKQALIAFLHTLTDKPFLNQSRETESLTLHQP